MSCSRVWGRSEERNEFADPSMFLIVHQVGVGSSEINSPTKRGDSRAGLLVRCQLPPTFVRAAQHRSGAELALQTSVMLCRVPLWPSHDLGNLRLPLDGHGAGVSLVINPPPFQNPGLS